MAIANAGPMITPVILTAFLAHGVTPKADVEVAPERDPQADDASIDRGIVFPTAETIGKGNVSVNSYELLGLGVTYGVTDSLQVSATTLVPVNEDFLGYVGFSGKLKLFTAARWTLAAVPSILIAKDEGFIFSGSLLSDLLLDEAGDAILSAGLTTSVLFDSGSGNQGPALTPHLGFAGRVSERVKLLAELSRVSLDGVLDDSFWLLNYGVRFFGSTLAVDISLLRPLEAMDSDALLLGLPYVAFSARW